MRVAVVGTAANETNALLVAAWRSLGLDCELLSGTQARAVAAELDVAVGRLDVRPSLDGIEQGLVELRLLERLGVRVLNRAMPLTTVHDKLETARCLTAAGIPPPVTIHVTDATVAKMPRPPVVLKPRYGAGDATSGSARPTMTCAAPWRSSPSASGSARTECWPSRSSPHRAETSAWSSQEDG